NHQVGIFLYLHVKYILGFLFVDIDDVEHSPEGASPGVGDRHGLVGRHGGITALKHPVALVYLGGAVRKGDLFANLICVAVAVASMVPGSKSVTCARSSFSQAPKRSSSAHAAASGALKVIRLKRFIVFCLYELSFNPSRNPW